MNPIDTWLYAASLFGLAFVIVVFLVSLTTYRTVALRFLRQAGPFFLFPALGFLVFVVGPDQGDAVTLFLMAQFVYLIFVFLGYVRGLLGLTGPATAAAGFGAFFGPVEPYLDGVLVIGSIYLAFTVTGSLLQRILIQRVGSVVVLASFLFLSAAVVAQVFYAFEGSVDFLRTALLAFLASVVLFELPLALSVPWGSSTAREETPRGRQQPN